jgi:hypothetical protein
LESLPIHRFFVAAGSQVVSAAACRAGMERQRRANNQNIIRADGNIENQI